MVGWSFYIDCLYQNNLVVWLSFLAILGAIVGSFINVVIYRLPIMLANSWRKEAAEILAMTITPTEHFNLLIPKSSCPNCNAPIAWYDNIPILSWILLRGRCRYCHNPINLHYPLVELLSILMTVSIGYFIPPGMMLIGALLFSWFILALAFIDARQQLLPDNLTLPFLWLGLIFNSANIYVPLIDAVWGAILGYLVLWSVFWIFRLMTNKDGMGYGDFKFLASLGAWLGWQQLLGIILFASLFGIFFTLLFKLFRRPAKKKTISFGFYLASVGWIIFMLIYALDQRPQNWLL